VTAVPGPDRTLAAAHRALTAAVVGTLPAVRDHEREQDRDPVLAVVEDPVWMTYWSDPDVLAAARTELLTLVTDAPADADHAAAYRCFAGPVGAARSRSRPGRSC
jgi:hypothetical protein